jgi:MYXO-CTERM domain-containing protein
MDGSGAARCVSANPCAGKTCEHGCVHGLCLQGPEARGQDADGDGFGILSDCDDANADANPDQTEIMGNGVDDDCDGFTDAEAPGPGGGEGGSTVIIGTGGTPGGSDDPGDSDGEGEDDGGCGCRATGGGDATVLGLLGAVLALVVARRRR